MIRVLSVVGTRPNFIKIGALHHAFSAHPDIASRLVHTGQHYDARMSDVFFKELLLPEPDQYLGVGSGTHAAQTADIMIAFERVLLEEKPDVVVVVGDVNSTMAAALVTVKLHVPLVHVESGLRSFDRSMPEEINRLVTDAVADVLYVSEQSGLDNLKAEGVSEDRVVFAGNVMIDSLVRFKAAAEKVNAAEPFGLQHGHYVLMTMHRPSNVDDPDQLSRVAELIDRISADTAVLFPIHPRTRARLEQHPAFAALKSRDRLHLVEPLSYLRFMNAMMFAGVVVTDSGGIQEETTFLKIPCITLRENTERPVTLTVGTNRLMPLDPEAVAALVDEALSGRWPAGGIPPLWDGRAAERIAADLAVRFTA